MTQTTKTTKTKKTKKALTAADIIKRDGYDKFLKRAGWDATEAQIRADYHPKIAARILAALPQPTPKPQAEVKAPAPIAAKSQPAKPGVKPALPASLEGRYIEYRVTKSKTTTKLERGIVLCEDGKPGRRIFEVLNMDGDVPVIKEADVERVGKHFAEMASAALA